MTETVLWPLTLPLHVLAGCSLTLPYPVIRHQPQFGPAIQQRRRSADVSVLRCAFELDRAQAQTLVAWWDEGLRGGESRFEWQGPLDDVPASWAVRTEPALRQESPLLWRADLELESALPAPPANPEDEAAWPETLPQDVLRGHSRPLPRMAIRSPAELGPTVTRRQGRAAAIQVDGVQLDLTRAQAIALRDWYLAEILAGTRRFSWRDPLSRGPGRLRFRAAPVLRHVAGGLWRAELPVEVLP